MCPLLRGGAARSGSVKSRMGTDEELEGHEEHLLCPEVPGFEVRGIGTYVKCNGNWYIC